MMDCDLTEIGEHGRGSPEHTNQNGVLADPRAPFRVRA